MKIKFWRRREPAPEPLGPAEVLLHAAAGRLGPLAQSATDRVSPLAQAAAGRMAAAADRVRPLTHSATDRVGPYAQQVTDRISPLAQHAYIFVEPYAHQAVDRVGPLAQTAKQRGAQAAQDAVQRFGPKLDDALDRVSPAVEAAQKKMNDELLPRLTEILTAAAATPAVVEATKRSKHTKGKRLPEPEPEQHKGRWVKRLAVVAAIGGIAAFAARKFLGSNDADWQAAKPSTPYAAPKPTTPTTDTIPAAASAAATNGQVDLSGDDVDAGTPAHQPFDEAGDTIAVDDAGDVTDELNDAGIEPVFDSSTQEIEFPDDVSTQGGGLSASSDEIADQEDATVPAADRSKYTGGGVYVGSEPPEGFSIKGNERSMKYHLPESAGYATTVSEVWFDSEEAAKEAGFIRAQR